MQTPTADHGNAVAAADPPAAQADAAAGLIPDEGARQREELTLLLAGFGTGLTIAGVFLIYIVMEAAKLLP